MTDWRCAVSILKAVANYANKNDMHSILYNVWHTSDTKFIRDEPILTFWLTGGAQPSILMKELIMQNTLSVSWPQLGWLKYKDQQ